MNRFSRCLSALTVLVVAAVLQSSVSAQPKPSNGPSSTHVFPAGGRRGTVVDVAVGGECVPPGSRFSLIGTTAAVKVLVPLLTRRLPDRGESSPRRSPTENPITYPKQWASRISIAANADTGAAYWRISCAQGGTCSRPFVVGDLPEWIEKESNSSVATANRIELPVTVNGQICGERDVDCFRFRADKGDVVNCEVVARRLGSPLDPNLSVMDATGRELPLTRRYLGSDIAVAAAITEAGEYCLRISNISLRGDPSCVYRLNISTDPFVFACFPAGAPAATRREITFYAMSGQDSPTVIRRSVFFPSKANTRFRYRSSWFANEVTLGVDGIPGRVESEPNNCESRSCELSLPVIVDGRFQSNCDVDWFSFHANKREQLSLICQSHPFPSAAMPHMTLFDSAGKQITDSSRKRLGAECRIEWAVPDDGTYRLRVRDVRFGSQGGMDCVYRLSVTSAKPDFSILLPQDCLNLTVGGKSQIPVEVERFGGFAGAIDIRVDGLPDDVNCETTTIPANANAANLRFTANDNARLGDTQLQVTGLAAMCEATVENVARARHLGTDGEGVSAGPATIDFVTLSVNRKPAFRLFCSEAYQYAHRGSVFMYPMEVERLNGFEGDITLQLGDRQNRDLDGIEMFEVTIPATRSKVMLPIHLPEGMHINVQSQSQLYSQGHAKFKDAANREQAVLVLAEKRNMLRTLPPVVKLRTLDNRVRVSDSTQIRFRMRLERTKNFDGPMQVHLIEPLCGAVSARAVEIPEGETDGELITHISSDWNPDSDPVRFRFRATGSMQDGTPLISETIVDVMR